MVFFAPLVGAAVLYSSLATAAPVPGMMSMSTSSYAPAYTAAPAMGSYGGNNYESSMMSESMMSESMKYESKSYYAPPPMYTSSEKAMYTTSYKADSTSSAYMSYSTPSYGSGMNNWGGYNDCVSQCIANNGGMSMGSYEKPTSTMSSEGSKGTGATHTVIVAPSQGVLRYVPMAVNASVGDTVMFMWGANNHTVTKGSALLPCNKTKDGFFTSGSHDKGFSFTQVVNDTKPTFFFCNTPGHCQKGMFGIINPANSAGSPTCAKNMMPSMMQNSTTLSSMNAYTNMMSTKTDAAMNWGENMDMSGVPAWAQESMGENIAFTRSFLAANPDVLEADGKVNMGKTGGAPYVVPKDLANPQNFNAVANSTVVPTAVSSTASAAATSSASSTPSTAASKNSGAISARSSAGLVSVAVAIAALVAL